MTRVLLCIVAATALAQAASPIIRVKFQPSTSVIVGQPIRLSVQVLVPSFFTSAPQFPTLEISSTMVAEAGDANVNLNETIGGIGYAGISHDYLIYPQTTGEFTLPPAEVVFNYSLDGGSPSPDVRMSLPREKFSATIPPEASGLDYFIASTRLTLTQRIDQPLTDLKQGDSFRRIVTVRSDQTLAMFLPPLRFTAPPGIAVYADAPQVSDERTDRGEFVAGRRMESASYVLQKPGSYMLPEISVSWWNLRAKRMMIAHAPAVEFSVSRNPDYRPEFPPIEETPVPAAQPQGSAARILKKWVAPIGAGIAALILLIWIWRRYAETVRAWNKARREARANSEAAAFRRLRERAVHNDAVGSMREFLRWKGKVVFSDLRDPDVDAQVRALEARLYGATKSSEWSGATFIHALSNGRRGLLKSKARMRPPLLPPLNP